ncbi:discoidin domain-containing protein [Termitidicoccus mucosus]|uniref:F5/8 type C domain-containing protein n=1 Tax=Termitidicoccus mucosus TaxID=1184151 RepID=A0A178II81_9BACT|nr:hypothetical protein AW736_13955 [Opitutaceae bacterium TSB47]
MKRILLIASLLAALACAADVFLGTQRINTDSGITLGPQGIAKRYLGTQLIFEAADEEEVLLTPAMTSNTAPSPFVITVSSVWDANPVNQAFRCFDQAFNASGWAGGGGGNLYNSSGVGNQWIQVNLGSTKTFTRIVLYSRNSGFNQLARNIIVQVSSDASDWTDVYTSADGDIANATAAQQVTLDKSITPTACQYIRITVTQIWGASTNADLGEIELYGH